MFCDQYTPPCLPPPTPISQFLYSAPSNKVEDCLCSESEVKHTRKTAHQFEMHVQRDWGGGGGEVGRGEGGCLLLICQGCLYKNHTSSLWWAFLVCCYELLVTGYVKDCVKTCFMHILRSFECHMFLFRLWPPVHCMRTWQGWFPD